MPTGFDVETGSALTPRLLQFVDRFWDHLKDLRPDGSNPVPVTGKHLCEWAKNDWGVDLEGPDVRAMVNYLRRNKKPIASLSDGYFVAVNLPELGSTILHMRERMAAINKACEGMQAYFTDGSQRTFL